MSHMKDLKLAIEDVLRVYYNYEEKDYPSAQSWLRDLHDTIVNLGEARLGPKDPGITINLNRPVENTMQYLELFHGRERPDEVLEDWGKRGPVFGPYESISITYGHHVKMLAPNGERVDDLFIHNEYVYYDGIYYGDFCIFSGEKLGVDPIERKVEFDPELAYRKE